MWKQHFLFFQYINAHCLRFTNTFQKITAQLKKYKYFSLDYRLSPSLLPLLDFTKQYFSLPCDFPFRDAKRVWWYLQLIFLCYLSRFRLFSAIHLVHFYFLSYKSHRFFQMNKISFYSNSSSIFFFWFIDKILDVFFFHLLAIIWRAQMFRKSIIWNVISERL